MRRKKQRPIQMYEGVWYAFRNPDLTECCDCGLVHNTEFKVDGTHMLWRAKVDKRATNRARKRDGITVTKNAKT